MARLEIILSNGGYNLQDLEAIQTFITKHNFDCYRILVEPIGGEIETSKKIHPQTIEKKPDANYVRYPA